MEVDTPLQWWQRFPIDFATDMLPISYHSEGAATIVMTPVTPRTRDDLEQEARAAGYAPAQPARPAPAQASATVPATVPATVSATAPATAPAELSAP